VSLIYTKESKPRRPVEAEHAVIAVAMSVLTDDGGGPLTSRAIYERACALGHVVNYHSVRARLAQHCDLDDAVVVRAAGSKLGVRGARGPGWVLRSTGRGVQCEATETGMLVRKLATPQSPADRARAKARLRARKCARAAHRARDLIVTDELIVGGPTALRAVAGYTVRNVILSNLDLGAARWLIERLPLKAALKARLLEADSGSARGLVIADIEWKNGRQKA